MTVVSDNHCVVETVDSPVVGHVAVELGVPSESCSGLEEPRLAVEVVITPGSLDSSAAVGRTIKPYPADLPRTAFHFLHMRMAAQLQSGSGTDSTVSIPIVAGKDHMPQLVESESECMPRRRIECREWDLLVQEPPRGFWKRIGIRVEKWFRRICCCGCGKRRKH